VFRFRRSAIYEIGEIIAFDLFQIADAYADQAKAGCPHLMCEQIAAGGEYAGGELRRTSQRASARAGFEISAFELERHG
jgi:hypothetical protein